MEIAKKTDVQEKDLMISEGSLFYNIALFEHIQRVAKIFASSTMVPAHFRGNLGNCLIALDYAARIKANPFMVMQNMYIVHGRPGIEGKLVIALINQSGRFEPLQFEQDEDGCRAFAKEKKSGKILKGPKVTWEMVKAEGWDQPKQTKDGKGVIKSKWETMPELMFMYRAAAFFARTHCPEVLLGMLTTEEIEDIIETRKVDNHTYEPEVESPPTTDGAVKLFDEIFADDKPLVDEFVVKTAEANGVSPEKVKADAVEQEAAFREAFLQWKSSQRKPAITQHEPQPQEPPKDVEMDPFRKEYINLRSSGFSTWVYKNLERVKQADPEHQEEIRAKWEKLYKDVKFPLDLEPNPEEPVEQEETPQQNGSNNGAATVFCPVKQSRVFLSVCETKCDKKENCVAYREAVMLLEAEEVEEENQEV